MVDCTKGFSDLTPYEAYRCFIEAEDWRIIGRNGQRMWANFTSTTIGEWVAIIFAFALLPAQFASYILPAVFIYRAFDRRRWGGEIVAGDVENKLKKWWGMYLLVCGGILVGFYHTDRFMLLQGAWEIFCGIAIFILGKSWWASAEKVPQ